MLWSRVIGQGVTGSREDTRKAAEGNVTKICAASGGDEEGANGEQTVAASDTAFRRVIMELLRIEEQGIFRNVICVVRLQSVQ